MIDLSLGNIVMGIIGMAMGIWITKEAYYINHHLLFFGWAERKWGPGYGTIAYRYIGLAMVIFSIFVFLGIIDLYGSAFGNAVGSRGRNPGGADPVTVPQATPGRNSIAP